eukprot:Rhum_TRINITY_DN13228_c2_g1::Rhum_TRINITY_DN13228_c2_g1_i1::g.58400::m.58400
MTDSDGCPRVVGQCTSYERPYFRTAPTDPAEIRPPSVIAEALLFVRAKADREHSSDDGGAAAAAAAAASPRYSYLCGQLKALRQDVATQGERGAVARDVYAAHAEESLRAGDAAEFVACHAALRELPRDVVGAPLAAELAAQRLVFQSATLKGTAAVAEAAPSGAAAHAQSAIAGDAAALLGSGDGAAAVRFACARAAMDGGLAAAYAGLPVAQRAVVDRFGARLRAEVLEAELKAAGPVRVSVGVLRRTLLLPDDGAVRAFVEAE